jgi:hypothetical protein
MKKITYFLLLLMSFFVINSCSNEREGEDGINKNSKIKFEKVSIIEQDGLHAESKYIDTKLKNVLENNIVIKDSKNVILANITTKVVANPDINLYSEDIPKDLNLDIYVYEGKQLAYTSGFRNGKKIDKVINKAFKREAVLEKYPCSFSGNLDCVDDRITDMSTWEYIRCLATADICYASQWIICVKYTCYGIR